MKKRIVCLFTAVVLSLVMMFPAMAGENFVASVPAKDYPPIVPVEGEDGEEYVGTIEEDEEIKDYVEEPCLVVTPISEVDSSTEIPEDAKELLKKVYRDLKDGSSTLPYDQYGLTDTDRLVIRDLFDATFLCGEHPPMLAEEGVVLRLRFNVGVDADDSVYVFTYINNQWTRIEEVINNGDGTVTCVFEDICPIAFVVETDDYVPPIKTGDNVGNLGLWFGLLITSGVALVVIAIVGFSRKNKVR